MKNDLAITTQQLQSLYDWHDGEGGITMMLRLESDGSLAVVQGSDRVLITRQGFENNLVESGAEMDKEEVMVNSPEPAVEREWRPMVIIPVDLLMVADRMRDVFHVHPYAETEIFWSTNTRRIILRKGESGYLETTFEERDA